MTHRTESPGPDDAVHIYGKCHGKLTVFMLSTRRWYRLRSFEDADRRWFAPPEDLTPVKRVTGGKRHDPDEVDAARRRAAEAFDRLWPVP